VIEDRTDSPAQNVAALLTGGGIGGIAVIGLRGPDAPRILNEIFSPRRAAGPVEPSADRLVLGEILEGGERLDEAIVNLRPDAGATYIAEINVHGGSRVCQRVLQLVGRMGAEVVDPGRFDAASWPMAAEGLGNPAIGREMLAHLPAAPTGAVVTLLTRQWSAGLSRLAHDAIAAIQSGSADADQLESSLRTAADRLSLCQRLLNPPEVVLAGPANAGKSSLANALLGREACIVTDVPGTTRDWVREPADLGGPAVWLTDTAGLWGPDDPLDREAVGRAWQRVDAADLVLAVFDAAAPPAADDEPWRRLLAETNVLLVANKIDLAPAPAGAVGVAASSGDGVADGRRAILARLGLDRLDLDLPAAFTERQEGLLRAAAAALVDRSASDAVNRLGQLLASR